jgi:hypothetical protein
MDSGASREIDKRGSSDILRHARIRAVGCKIVWSRTGQNNKMDKSASYCTVYLPGSEF